MNNWDRESLEIWLKDKDVRTLNINEYLLLIDFINKIKPDTVVDIGTFLGASGYVIGTCCESIKNLYSIDNINSPEYYPKPEATKEEHGKYLPDNAIFLTCGYENYVLKDIIKQHPDAFVFWDAGKNTLKVINQLKMSYDYNIKYIAIHDTGLMRVRKAIRRAERMKWYRIIEEDIESDPDKGITIMELIVNED